MPAERPDHTDQDADAASMLPVVYDELKRIAMRRMAGEKPGHTLQATALVHEAYLRLTATESSNRTWKNERHFVGDAAEAMRRILIDSARARNRIERGGDLERTALEESQIITPLPSEELLAVDEVLDRFQEVDPEGAELVKLRYFCGFTLQEIADYKGYSVRTAKRHWSYARAWLHAEIDGD